MTQEHKELLLKDLCGRLPYGVKCDVGDDKPYTLSRIEIDDKNGHILDFKEKKDGLDMQVYLSEVKPYLYPLSSMTEEQGKELQELYFDYISDEILNSIEFVYHYDCKRLIDWLNKNHFDYMGFIPMGLAKDATNLNIYG